MPLKLYNTLGRKLEDFTPRDEHDVGMYTCGPTVYNFAHLGNLRTYIFEDVLRRTLQLDGYTVKHVMNVTDVGHLTGDGDMGEDKIAKASRETQRDAYTIAREYEAAFFDDLKKLNILQPSVTLRATETIELQIKLIKKLETNGFTYITSDGVYFDTSQLSSYGLLSGQKSSDKKAGARVEVNNEKKNPTDFALWKFSKPEDKRQMEWPSPWGVGFPGWHIECSAMSISEFPKGLDIHCGGIDHIAVHHENEIAQNEASGHKDFVKVWMHGEFLKLPGKRMGKSEGNAILLQDVVDKGIDPLAYRYLCLQTHYRKPLSFTWDSLEAAAEGLKNLQRSVSALGSEAKIGCAEFEEHFQQAVNDDLNTAKAMAVIQELLRSDYPNHAKLQSLRVMDHVLGLDLTVVENVAVPADVQELAHQREQARKNGDFAKADELRKLSEQKGFLIEDTPDGSRLRKK